MKLCQKWILIGLLAIGSCCGEEANSMQSLIVNSGEAEYDGQGISLAGDAVVHHDLGTVSAHRFTITPSGKSRKQRFSNLAMSEDVSVEFKKGGRLTCERAEVDYGNLCGVFFGTPEKPDVVYVQALPDGELILKGNQLQVKFKESQGVELGYIQMSGDVRIYYNSPCASAAAFGLKPKLPRLRFRQCPNIETNIRALAESQPRGFGSAEMPLPKRKVSYNQDYILTADQAIFQPGSPSSSLETAVGAGHLVLTAIHRPHCEATSSKGDHLLAKSITIDTLKESISLVGDVHVSDHGLLRLKTDHQLVINHLTVNGKKEIRTIESLQDTEVSYMDEKRETEHKVFCHGRLILDHENSQIWMHSPKDNLGHVLEGKQVFFDNLMGEMYADQVQFIYSQSSKFIPIKMILIGNVHIFNRFDGHVQESGSVLQYALADQVEYIPDAQEMLLSGLNGNRILFFDKINSLQMSAPALKIHFDKTTHKESLQGIGDVRFTFIEREFNQLKERFRLR